MIVSYDIPMIDPVYLIFSSTYPNQKIKLLLCIPQSISVLLNFFGNKLNDVYRFAKWNPRKAQFYFLEEEFYFIFFLLKKIRNYSRHGNFTSFIYKCDRIKRFLTFLPVADRQMRNIN